MDGTTLRVVRHRGDVRKRRRNWLRAGILLPLAAIAAIAAPASPAAAAELPVRVTDTNVNMRACASTSCAVIATAQPSHALISFCFRSGSTANGNPFWDVVYNTTTGTAGFISESLLNDTSQGTPCGSGGLTTSTVQDGVNIRACSSTVCNVAGQANAAHTLTSYCFDSGQSINGNPFWDVVYNTATGRAGFITEFYLTNQSQGNLC